MFVTNPNANRMGAFDQNNQFICTAPQNMETLGKGIHQSFVIDGHPLMGCISDRGLMLHRLPVDCVSGSSAEERRGEGQSGVEWSVLRATQGLVGSKRARSLACLPA